MTKKYKCTIDVDESHVKRFDLTFEAEDEEDAEAQALMEVKQNLHDYVTVCAEEMSRMTITWNTGLAAARARHNLKLKKNKKIKKRVRAQARKRPSFKLDRSNWGLPRVIKH